MSLCRWGGLDRAVRQGRELLSHLMAVSDAVTENFAGGVFARLGFPYERLQELKPDIVYVSNSGFGASGPYREYRTWGPIVQAVGGLTFTSALHGHEPAGWGYSYMDHLGAYAMATAVLAALWHRERTGERQWVDLSCSELALGLTGTDLLDAAVNSRPPCPPRTLDANRSSSPPMTPHGIYPTAGEDQWIAIASRDNADWQRMRGLVGDPWAADERFRSLDGRRAAENSLDARPGRGAS